MSEEIRDIFIKRLKEDLMGPAISENETINERPTDMYMTGILYPQNQSMSGEDDEKLDTEIGKGIPEGESSAEIPVGRSFKPASAGISFSLISDKSSPSIKAIISCGLYSPFWIDANGNQYQEKPVNIKPKPELRWTRRPIKAEISLEIGIGTKEINLDQYGLPNIYLFIKASKYKKATTVTLQTYNGHRFEDTIPFYIREAAALFQFKMKVEPQKGTSLVPRPVVSYAGDEDTEIAALIYRDTKEYATGHTCAAIWHENENGAVSVETEWMPQQKVYSVDSNGDKIFSEEFEKHKAELPNAQLLSEADLKTCVKSLSVLVGAYEQWIENEQKKIASLNSESLIKRAQKNIDDTKKMAIGRMRAGIELIQNDPKAFQSFQLANKAMQIQASWKSGYPSGKPETDKAILKWRPFQLAFCLMALCSLVDKNSSDRDIMDLIWFPTGGGKTEAYLLLTAFTLFYRRISTDKKQAAYGVAVFMRYTLRTLTVQQFDRAAALITACDVVRTSSSEITALLGEKRFSIGLWVGKDSTPNNFDQAEQSLEKNDEGTTPIQIEKCPACRSKLLWDCDHQTKRIIASCKKEDCSLEEIPILTVDDQIYEELPSLLIGTVDKFAQIVRKKEAVKLFGINTPYNPPDLIIQDELHLISGPLGTIAAIYETAIDKFCSAKGYRPKIIGSTATIRRAKEQVKDLFDRKAYQFPPPIIDADNSCFAKTDHNSPGRIYIGTTTAGRSEKFVLQAVTASLIQSLQDKTINQEEADSFATLVAYFNSLRILGGALVVMQDDVEQSLEAYAQRRNEEKRITNAPEEMTSRKKSKEIPQILGKLELKKGDPDFIDILLATNMLSVGVDIRRLGLMLVVGQPKTMSEYIQATSRVGRQAVPGLIVTMYNNNKTRDRAHYESFKTWHQSLYRELEGSSVTPFAARARDKALHAALIVLSRHLVKGLSDSPVLTPPLRKEVEKMVVPYILERVEAIDKRELEDTKLQIANILEEWETRDGLQHYWSGRKHSLLVSADDVAQLSAAYNKKKEGISTPNSMRNVEAQTTYFLKEFSKPYEDRKEVSITDESKKQAANE